MLAYIPIWLVCSLRLLAYIPIRSVRTLCLQTYIYLRSVRTLCSAIFKLIPFPSAYGLSGWCCSPKVGELRVAVRGMSFRSITCCLAFVSYPLRFARPPTLGGQLHPVCSLAAFACSYSRPVSLLAAFACLYSRPVSSLAAFSYLQTYSISLSLRAIRTALLP